MRRLIAAAALMFCLIPARPASAQGAIPADTAPEAPFSPTIHALLFGDATYVASDRKIPEGVLLGQLVGHITASLSDRLYFFSELSATAQSGGYAFEVERSILRYDFSDAVKLSVGRYHTPIGYWNTHFHHGTWLQTTVSRPEMVKFGSQLIPIHFVGAVVEGSVPANGLGLGYMLGLGNGRGSIISRAGDAGDVNGNRAWTASVSARPASLFGMEVGGGYYHDRVTPASAPAATEGISSAYFAWQRERPEVIAEYVHIGHTPIGGGESSSNNAGYVQLAYRLMGAAHLFKPYVRAERISTAASDVIFAPLALGYEGGIAGVRYDFEQFAALKAEYRREQFQNHDWSNGVYVQASFTVPDLGGGDHNSMHE